MGDTKPPIRRAAHATVGSVFWALKDDEATEAEKKLAEGLVPGFEGAMKTMTASALNSPSGPLEGYVAVAVVKSRAKKWDVKKIGASPSFLPPALRADLFSHRCSPREPYAFATRPSGCQAEFFPLRQGLPQGCDCRGWDLVCPRTRGRMEE